jgi:hypothetical protein
MTLPIAKAGALAASVKNPGGDVPDPVRAEAQFGEEVQCTPRPAMDSPSMTLPEATESGLF